MDLEILGLGLMKRIQEFFGRDVEIGLSNGDHPIFPENLPEVYEDFWFETFFHVLKFS